VINTAFYWWVGGEGEGGRREEKLEAKLFWGTGRTGLPPKYILRELT